MSKRKPYTDALGPIPDEWHEGFACAVAQVARMGHPSIAKAVMIGSGMSVKQLKENGIEPYDLAPIQKVMRKSQRSAP